MEQNINNKDHIRLKFHFVGAFYNIPVSITFTSTKKDEHRFYYNTFNILLTRTITMIGRQILITAGYFVLDEPDDISEREGSSAGPASQGVCRDSGGWGATAFCRAVRIRWEQREIKHIVCVWFFYWLVCIVQCRWSQMDSSVDYNKVDMWTWLGQLFWTVVFNFRCKSSPELVYCRMLKKKSWISYLHNKKNQYLNMIKSRPNYIG